MEKNGRAWRIDLTAAALVAPLIFAPITAAGAMAWARYESVRIHPDLAAKNPPTISRAIADPKIGDIFALWMLGVAALQAFAVIRIARAFHRTALLSGPPGYRAGMTALFYSMLLCQAVAICGLVVLSQYTGSISDYLHQLGSYMLFFGNGFSILFCGIFVSLDHNHRKPDNTDKSAPPCPYDFLLQYRLAIAVTIISLFFAFLFFDDDYLRGLNDYGYRLTFAMCEIVLLVASLIYLGSFVLSMYRYERYFLARRTLARDAVPVTGEA